MPEDGLKKVTVVLAILAVTIAVLFHFFHRTSPPSPVKPATSAAPAAIPKPDEFAHDEFTNLPVASPEAATNENQPREWQPRVSREQIEAYLEKCHRDAPSLLAAWHASLDENYLKEAATNFPNDPQTQWSVVAQNAFPEQRRQWLDAFKESSPDNPLANYFSAGDYFKHGQTNEALAELMAAADKGGFQNFIAQARLNEEDLNLSAGKSSLEARQDSLGWGAEVFPTCMEAKSLVRNVSDLQKTALAAGDAESASQLAQLGLSVAAQFQNGEGGKLLINQLVGIADEGIVVRALNQDTPYDFLGGKTPKEYLVVLKERKLFLRSLSTLQIELFPRLSEQEIAHFYERQSVLGEMEALRWLQQRYGTNAAR